MQIKQLLIDCRKEQAELNSLINKREYIYETGFEGSSGKDFLCPAANAEREKRIRIYADTDPVI